jgi:hypothetical protein
MVCGDLTYLVRIDPNDKDQIALVIDRIHAYALRYDVRDSVGADSPRTNGRHQDDGGHCVASNLRVYSSPGVRVINE